MSTGLGPFDLVALFSSVFGEMTTVRSSRGLTPLVSTHIGKEWLLQEEAAPRVVVIPERMQYAPARGLGNQTSHVGDFNPKALYRRFVTCKAYLWGDQPAVSTETDTWVSFNTAVEIEREFLVALSHNLGGPAAVISSNMSAEWDQPTDDTRLGRLLVLTFAFETPVTQEPYIVLPFATASSSGAQVSATLETVFPDGSSSIAGVIVTPP